MTERQGGWLKQHWLKLVASLAIALGFAWVLHAGALPIVPNRAAFAHVRWWTVAAYLVLWSIIHFVRAVRWHWLLLPVHRVPVRQVIAVAWMGFAAILFLPFRTGEAVRPIMIRKKGHLSGWVATGTVGAERVIDGLVLSVILFVALSLSHPLDPLPRSMPAAVVPGAAYSALGMFAMAFTIMGIFYWRRELARRLTERVVGLVSKKLASWLAERVENVADGLRFLPRARFFVPFMLLTLVYWTLNAGATWLLAWGSGFADMTYVEACVSMGVLALGILLPNAPGFFGAFQISIYAGLAMFFPPEQVVGPGAAFVLLIYLSQIGITFVGGILGMAWERTGVREALSSVAPADD
jgi:hypothetical protein